MNKILGTILALFFSLTIISCDDQTATPTTPTTTTPTAATFELIGTWQTTFSTMCPSGAVANVITTTVVTSVPASSWSAVWETYGGGASAGSGSDEVVTFDNTSRKFIGKVLTSTLGNVGKYYRQTWTSISSNVTTNTGYAKCATQAEAETTMVVENMLQSTRQ